jgi:glucokinase
MKRIMAIDAGGTWVKAAVFNEQLREMARVKKPSGAARGLEEYVASMAASVQELGGAEVVGLSLPGVFTKDRQRLQYSPNVKGLTVGGAGLEVRELKKRLGVKLIVAENDAKCAALGEWALGYGEGKPDNYLLHLTWGTGIGTGLVIEGKPQYGWEGGHLPLRGSSLEQQIAVPALVRKAREVLKDTVEDDRQLPIELSRWAREGEAQAQEILRAALTDLAWAIEVMGVLAYPDIITIGGAMMDSDWLLEELRHKIRASSRGIVAAAVRPERVFRAKLGNDAGMMGAALLAKELTGV